MAKLLSGKFNPITNVSCIHYAINLSPFVVSDKVALRNSNLVMGLYSHITIALSVKMTVPAIVSLTQELMTTKQVAASCVKKHVASLAQV